MYKYDLYVLHLALQYQVVHLIFLLFHVHSFDIHKQFCLNLVLLFHCHMHVVLSLLLHKNSYIHRPLLYDFHCKYNGVLYELVAFLILLFFHVHSFGIHKQFFLVLVLLFLHHMHVVLSLLLHKHNCIHHHLLYDFHCKSYYDYLLH